jgi:hypothetical protein
MRLKLPPLPLAVHRCTPRLGVLAISFLVLSPLSARVCRASASLSFSDAKGNTGEAPLTGPHSATFVGVAATAALSGQQGFGPLDPTPPKDLTPDEIVKRFGERETAFAKARDQYTFRQTVRVDTVDDDTGKVDGEYQQVTDIVFSNNGTRSEHVVFAPANSITRVMMNEHDFDDIEKRLPFVLTTAELPDYDLTYLGRQKVDEIDTYVFECKPKTLVKNHRYYQGKIWVDQQQFQIVLINGKSVPDDTRPGHADLSPPYTTYYQEVDGGNWFPVYTKGDGVLHFPGGKGYMADDVHLRYVVKYEDYKRFHAKSTIIYNGEDLPPADPNAKPSTTPDGSATSTPNDNPNALPPPDLNAPPLVRPATPKPTPPQ